MDDDTTTDTSAYAYGTDAGTSSYTSDMTPDGSDVGTASGGYETVYGGGYGTTEAHDSYVDHTVAANSLYQASSEAALNGDSSGAYDLNAASLAESSNANDSWDEWNGTGSYAPTYESTDSDAASYSTTDSDAGAYSATDSDAAAYSATDSDAAAYSATDSDAASYSATDSDASAY